MSKVRIAVLFVVNFLAGAATTTMSSPAGPQVEQWELVARVCGKLEHTQQVPDKNNFGRYLNKNSPIKDAKLVLYEAPNNSVCCSNVPVAGEMTTNKSGAFEFKGLKNGYYWLVARVDSRDYHMSIRIGQLKDKQPVCSQMFFDIDESGEFALHFRAPGR